MIYLFIYTYIFIYYLSHYSASEGLSEVVMVWMSLLKQLKKASHSGMQ